MSKFSKLLAVLAVLFSVIANAQTVAIESTSTRNAIATDAAQPTGRSRAVRHGIAAPSFKAFDFGFDGPGRRQLLIEVNADFEPAGEVLVFENDVLKEHFKPLVRGNTPSSNRTKIQAATASVRIIMTFEEVGERTIQVVVPQPSGVVGEPFRSPAWSFTVSPVGIWYNSCKLAASQSIRNTAQLTLYDIVPPAEMQVSFGSIELGTAKLSDAHEYGGSKVMVANYNVVYPEFLQSEMAAIVSAQGAGGGGATPQLTLTSGSLTVQLPLNPMMLETSTFGECWN